MKKFLFLLPLVACSLVSCGGAQNPDPKPEPQPTPVQKVVDSVVLKTGPSKTTYTEGETFNSTGMVLTVSYVGGTSEDITSGWTITPSRALTTEDTKVTVTYSGKSVDVPITVNPKLTDKQIFLNAKNKTYENNIYEYTYLAQAQIKFKDAVSWSPAKLSGTVQYDSSAKNTQYMHKKEISGALVFDYTTYTYNQGLDMITLNANEKKDFSIVNKETLPNNYQFETNSIGYILKALADNDNLKVTKNDDQYHLDLKTNFAQDSLLRVLNYIDSKKIIDTLSSYTTDKWGVGFTYDCYATLNSTKTAVSSFHFEAGVSIKETFDIQFVFDQNFTKIGSGVKISLPEFENTLVDEQDISSELFTLKSSLSESKKNYYDYKVKTAVDHGVSKSNPLGLAVNSTSAGYARRQIIGNDVYFHNRLEVDSDYKNKDQLGDLVDDYERYRAKLSTGEVYDITDGIKNTYDLLDDYNNDNIDDYYMMILDSWLTSDAVKILRKESDGKNNTLYKLGVSSETIKNILETYNKSIRIDAKGETEVKVYNIVNSFEPKKSEIEILVDQDNKINSIDFDLKGFYVCETEKQVKFNFDLEIDFDYTKNPYTAPSDKKDVVLSHAVN